MFLALLLLSCRAADGDKDAPTASDSASAVHDSDGGGGADSGTTDGGTGGGSTDGGSTDGGTDGGTFDLVDPYAWVALGAEDDPFASHRPETVECEPEALSVDLGLFEVDTGACDYLSASQPSLAAVAAGDRLGVLMYHDSLTFWTEAEAHVALALGDDVVWEASIAIPASSEVYSVELEAPADAPAGTPVTFHLHNHGSNTWNLGHFRVTR